ncbi:MAG: hypothetical protein EX285_05715, partial [Thaumarchaeota archaeon]|nr:hypothetical protein [Nitrososphaerota archaeon]
MTSNIVFYDLDKRETLRTLPISVGSRDWWVNDDNVITGTCRTGIYNLNSINKYKADTLNVSGFIISATGAGDRVYLSKSYSENDIQYENWIEVWSFDKEAIVEKIELKKSYIVYDLKVSADNKFLALFRTNLEIGKSEFCIYNLSTDDIKVVNTFSEEFVNDIWGPSMIQWSNDTCYFSVINEVTEQQKYYTYSNGVTTPLFENNIADLNSSFTVFEGKLYKLKKNNY